jgi:hypothetical protein
MLRGSNHDPVLLETVDLSRQELQRLTALLSDYRTFAMPQSVDVQPTHLRQLFGEVLALRLTITARGELRASEGAPVCDSRSGRYGRGIPECMEVFHHQT